MKSLTVKSLLPHLLAVVFFVGLALSYTSPVMKGKELTMHDIKQSDGTSHELKKYWKETGELPRWTNSTFGGMPGFMIVNDYSSSVSMTIARFMNRRLPETTNYLFICMLGFYVLAVSLGANAWLGVMGSVAFTFASYTLISLGAGHVSKIIAIGYAPGILAGVVLVFRGRYWLGGALLSLFLGLELYANHYQITYYFAVALGIYVVIEGVVALRDGRLAHLSKAAAMLALGGAIAVGTLANSLWNVYDYTKETTRGKANLTITPGGGAAVSAKPKEGLDYDYAFNWSYGIGETFTYLIPNFRGGGSSKGLTTQSETYKTLAANGVADEAIQQFLPSISTYFGNQPGTSGPAYMGAIVCFLFILGLFVVPGRFKWWLLSATVLFTVWACGKNLAAINYLFFDYFPMFNKFRAVTMVHALVQLVMVTLAVLTVKELTDRKPTWQAVSKPFYISLALTAGLCALFALLPTLFSDFRATGLDNPADKGLYDSLMGGAKNEAFAQGVINSLISDRTSMFRADALRSLLFIVLAAGALWLFIINKLKPAVLFPVLLVLVMADEITVARRYLNNDNFATKTIEGEEFVPTAADLQILQDKDPHFRVIDVTTSTFMDGRACYFHKSVGGYHAAKLRRFMDLVDFQISKNNMRVLDMLNTKYFIVQNPQTGAPEAQQNPTALGNAWFVGRYKTVPDANAEMRALDSLDVRNEAVFDQQFAPKLSGLAIKSDTANSIRLTNYKPHVLTYQTNAKTEQLAVFSEMYYNVRDEWQVRIDGQPAQYMRANYALRALRVPAGKHTIVCQFDPISDRIGQKIDIGASILMLCFFAAALFFETRKPKDAQEN